MAATLASVPAILSSISRPVKLDALSPPLHRFFEAELPRCAAVEMDPAAHYTLRRDTASIMKIGFSADNIRRQNYSHFSFKQQFVEKPLAFFSISR